MAKNDNIAGVLSPTTTERDSFTDPQQVPGYRMSAHSPRYQQLSSARNSTIEASLREKPPSKLGHGSSIFNKEPPGMEMNPNFTLPGTYPSTISPPNGLTETFKQPDNLINSQNARRHQNSYGNELRQQSPLPHFRTHHHSNTISSIASLISPHPTDSFNNSYGMQKPSARDIAPWIESDQINRPKSADMTSPGGTMPNFSRGMQFPMRSQFGGPSAVNSISETNDLDPDGLPPFDPHGWGGASALTSTGAPSFVSGATKGSNDMVNSTAMKLASLSTGTNDAKKFHRHSLNLSMLSSTNDGSSLGALSPISSDLRRDFGPVPVRFREQQDLSYDSVGAIGDFTAGPVMNQQPVAQPVSPLIDRSRPLSPEHGTTYNSTPMGMRSPTSWGIGFSFPNPPVQQQQQQQQQQSTYVTSPYRAKSDASTTQAKSRRHKSSSSIDQSIKDIKQSPSKLAPAPVEAMPDLTLLEDIGAWLKSLRLHKYTDCLKNLPWQELIELSDSELEARGVNALGARRKMLKVFEQIKEAQMSGALK